MDIEGRIPDDVKGVMFTLVCHDFKSYLVGGALRDMAIERDVSDWDITTNALPHEVKEVFKNFKVIETGIKHGTVTVVVENEPIEITTLRTDGDYSDNRRPDEVYFTDSINDDLARRDFTINAMAYNPQVGLVDPFSGVEDLKNQLIQCVGDPNQRFKEDALRMMRAVRFSSQLGFRIENKTADAIFNNHNRINMVSSERINSEFNKIVCSNNSANGVTQLYLLGLLEHFIPELYNLFGIIQNNPNHRFTSVGQHSLSALKYMSNTSSGLHLRLAALLHDIGKQYCKTTEDGIDHFYGHEKISADKVEDILIRLKYDNATIKKVRELIYWHGTPIHNTKKSVRRALNKIGEEYFLDLLLLKDSDDYAKKQTDEVAGRIARRIEVREIYKEILEEEECFKLKDLAVNGDDLVGIGFKQDKFLGFVLGELLDFVINNPDFNKKEALIHIASMAHDHWDTFVGRSKNEAKYMFDIYTLMAIDQLPNFDSEKIVKPEYHVCPDGKCIGWVSPLDHECL